MGNRELPFPTVEIKVATLQVIGMVANLDWEGDG